MCVCGGGGGGGVQALLGLPWLLMQQVSKFTKIALFQNNLSTKAQLMLVFSYTIYGATLGLQMYGYVFVMKTVQFLLK